MFTSLPSLLKIFYILVEPYLLLTFMFVFSLKTFNNFKMFMKFLIYSRLWVTCWENEELTVKHCNQTHI